jgi:molybdopterin-binding protein
MFPKTANQFIGRIRHISAGPMLSEVEVDTYRGIFVTSLMATRSLEELELQVGQEVLAAIKGFEVAILARRSPHRSNAFATALLRAVQLAAQRFFYPNCRGQTGQSLPPY